MMAIFDAFEASAGNAGKWEDERKPQQLEQNPPQHSFLPTPGRLTNGERR
jgi:hypothetical protein